MTQPPQGDHILLSEWAGADIGPRFLGASQRRDPCPVCGHPTMDCTTHPSPTRVPQED